MKKSAILFGINEYHDCPLQNAVNDASALSEKLSELGFDAECFLNVTREDMDRALQTFRAKLEQSSVGLFFFAGHGIQCKGENYLAIKDTNFFDDISCKHTSFPLNDVIDIFEESKVTTKILILDACRDNPFVTWRSTANEGLAPIYAPKGTIIAFSTSPGQKASDGKNGHGVYTEALLTHIATKNLAIEDMFKRVRNTVSSHTGHRQITWEHTSLMGTFYFNSGIDGDEARPTYSTDALADQNYIFEREDEIESIVNALKTYNWYKQNPAIKKINRTDFSHSDKDDLFILGRNIYQAACGGSGNAESWIENIEANLDDIGGSAAIHLLNGILFEIYFNSKGQIRTNLKSEQYEKPVKLCMKSKFAACGLFIRDYLEQYPQQIIYIPGSKNFLTTDILISKENDEYHIDGIYIDGLSCMYDENATEFYEYNDTSYFYREVTLPELENIILEKIAAPRSKIKFTCNIPIPATTSILIPYNFRLLRYI
ncbi:MAG: caspase domain-containing protein [Oscillospiraceae bacterium]